MRQLKCIATYCRLLGAPQNIRHPKSQYATTRHVNSRQSFVLTEFVSASINNYCLDSRRLHCLTRLTSCHQHSHVSSTHARAHALSCAVKRDLVTRHSINYYYYYYYYYFLFLCHDLNLLLHDLQRW